MNSYTRLDCIRVKVANKGCFFHFKFLTREYELYEHANAISESAVVNTSTLERTIITITRNTSFRF